VLVIFQPAGNQRGRQRHQQPFQRLDRRESGVTTPGQPGKVAQAAQQRRRQRPHHHSGRPQDARQPQPAPAVLCLAKNSHTVLVRMMNAGSHARARPQYYPKCADFSTGTSPFIHRSRFDNPFI
jgi:hypothetical protein